jgi:diguanylate cyclase (GGDEF)-like protein
MTAGPEPDDVRRLAEDVVAERERRLYPRELLVEGLITAGFLALAAVLLAMAGGEHAVHPAAVPAVLAYLLASRVEFPLGAGFVVPTEPFLIALFGLADPAMVPLLVLVALAGGRLLDAAAGRSHPERLVFSAGDAMHALGPAAVLVAAGGLAGMTPLLVVAAFGAQALVDLVCSIGREWVGHGVRPRLQARVVLHVWGVDAALLPVGVLAVVAAQDFPLAPLALLPVLVLLSSAARGRQEEVERADDRRRAIERLHRQAVTDELTGLANHRRLQELADAAVAAWQEDGTPAAVVMLDLDDFKAVNDRHGHHVGDEVLRAAGRALRDACREGDEPARYGGEELAVVLAGGDEADAAACAERIRAAVAAIDVRANGRRLPVTTSCGVAALGGDVRTKAALLEAADAALYRAKAAGKNRVEVAGVVGLAA